jgi:SAM-dependent methyltransferase
MRQSSQPRGSAARWGPLFGARAHDWADTWEGPRGWGTPIYEHVLVRAKIGPGTRVLDCGCGAGRFPHMAADRGAIVAGVDAAAPLVEVAADRTPEGDFRVGDLEALPWPDDSFDIVTGFSSFQFADDKARALGEARRVSRGQVVVVIPSRVPESGITQMFKPLLPLFPPEALENMKHSGMFALSEPGRLEQVIAAAGLNPRDDDEVECTILFEGVDSAVRAFMGAGPTALAIQHSGEGVVADAVRRGLDPFTDAEGHVTLPGWYRAVIAEA